MAALLLCIACKGQPQVDINSIPTMEYYDVESDSIEVNYVMFDFSCVIDLNYEAETKIYSVEYDDSDAFDYDNLAYIIGEDYWYGDFIICYIDSADFYELLIDMNKSKEEKWDMTYAEKWQVKEVRTAVEGGYNLRFYIVKNPIYAN